MDAKRQHWFMRFLEGFVSKPDEAMFTVDKGLFELEVMLRVAPEDRALFTPQVLGAFEVILAARTGISNIKIDLEGSSFFTMKEIQSYI